MVIIIFLISCTHFCFFRIFSIATLAFFILNFFLRFILLLSFSNNFEPFYQHCFLLILLVLLIYCNQLVYIAKSISTFIYYQHNIHSTTITECPQLPFLVSFAASVILRVLNTKELIQLKEKLKSVLQLLVEILQKLIRPTRNSQVTTIMKCAIPAAPNRLESVAILMRV